MDLRTPSQLGCRGLGNRTPYHLLVKTSKSPMVSNLVDRAEVSGGLTGAAETAGHVEAEQREVEECLCLHF